MTLISKVLRRSYLLYCAMWKPLLASRQITFGPGVRFIGIPSITTVRGSRIQIGSRAVLCSSSRFADLGVSRGLILHTARPGAEIVIGRDCGLTGAVIVAASSIRIGDECLFGANVTVADTDFHPLAPQGRRYEQNPAKVPARPVVIGNNVFIGTQAVILKGVTIGDNSVIGAGAVVTGNIPANCIAAGNPAKVIRPLETVPTPAVLVPLHEPQFERLREVEPA